jgi:hypothetical protein
MRRPPLASRRPPSYPIRARLWRLRIAALAETNRLKYALTMQAVGEGVPEVVEGDATVRLPRETMTEVVFGRAA